MADSVDAQAREAARSSLAAVTARFGTSILNEARRFEAAVADAFGPDHRKERVALCNAVHAGIPKALRAESGEQVPRAMAVAELARRLADETAMDAAMARWAVDALADALGVAGAQESESDRVRGVEIDLRPRSRRTIVLLVVAIVVAIAGGATVWAVGAGWNPFVVP